MLPTEGRAAKFIGQVGAELDVEAGRNAAYLAALNGLAVARQHLGSLDRVTRIIRLGVSVATPRDFRDHPKVADGASELLQDVFGKDKNPSRLVYGVASLPLGTPVELELIFEVSALPLPPRNSRSSFQKRFARASGHCANSGAEESRSHFRQPAYLWSAIGGLRPIRKEVIRTFNAQTLDLMKWPDA
jgi:enamine deaminase RidA (YjgF/YER057c/UK114 family)